MVVSKIHDFFFHLKGQYHLITSVIFKYYTFTTYEFKVFILRKSKIHIRRHFPRVDMGWRPLARVCLWLHVSSRLRSTRGRYIVSINMACILRRSIAYPFQVFTSFYFLIDIIKRNFSFHGYYNFSRSFFWNQLVTRWYCPSNLKNKRDFFFGTRLLWKLEALKIK